MALATDIHKRWNKPAKRAHLEEWCRALWDVVGDCTPERRALFVAYLFSDEYLKGRAYPGGVLNAIETDGARWRAEGYPARKGRGGPPRASAGARRPTIMSFAEIQREQEEIGVSCKLCGRRLGERHQPRCKSSLGDQLVQESQQCVV